MEHVRTPSVRHLPTLRARGPLIAAVVLALVCTVTPWVVSSSSASTSERARVSADTEVARGLRAFDVRWRRVTAGFSAPTQVTSAPDGRKRLFVVQKGGQVKIVRDGHLVRRSYISIGRRVATSGERGLLSVAFSPTFRRDGLLWVAYSRRIDGDFVVARMHARSAKAAHVRSKTLRPILRVEHSQFDNHNGGQLAFGAGKRLFIGTGDGGSAGDPGNNASDRNSLLGKILRIDPFERCRHRGYCVPKGNPLKDKRGRDEIWLMGVRNPWRFSVDPRTHDLWIGDVGQDRFEEIDHVGQHAKRFHLGWSCREGRKIYRASRCHRSVDYIAPKVVIRHPIAQSITGGFVYRGHRFKRQIGGAYVFGDFITRRIWLYKPGAGKVVQDARIAGNPTSFGVNDRGEIYAVTYDGTLWAMRVVRG